MYKNLIPISFVLYYTLLYTALCLMMFLSVRRLSSRKLFHTFLRNYKSLNLVKLLWAMLFSLMHYKIHCSLTSCSPNTYILFQILALYEIFITFFSGITNQGFLKFGTILVSMPNSNLVMLFKTHLTSNLCLLLKYL